MGCTAWPTAPCGLGHHQGQELVYESCTACYMLICFKAWLGLRITFAELLWCHMAERAQALPPWEANTSIRTRLIHQLQVASDPVVKCVNVAKQRMP